MLRRIQAIPMRAIHERGHSLRITLILATLMTTVATATLAMALPANAQGVNALVLDAGQGVSDLAQVTSLEDIFLVAMNHSPRLVVGRLEQDEAFAGKRQVDAALKPQLTIAGQHTVENAANNPMFGAGRAPDDRIKTTVGSLTWYQQLGPNAQLKGALDLAKAGEDLARLRQEQILNDMIMAVETSYHGVLRAYYGLTLAKEAQEHALLNLEAEEARQSLGTATPLDVLKEKNAYLEAKQGVHTAEMGVEMAVLSLLQTIGLDMVDGETAQGWAKQVADAHKLAVVPWEVDLDTALGLMVRCKPELAMVRKQKAMAKSALDQTKGERDWTIKLSGKYQADDKTTLQSSVDSNRAWVSTVVRTELPELPDIPSDMPTPPLDDTDPWQIDLNVSYRFGDGGAKKAKVVAKEAALEKAELQLAMAEDGFYLELNAAIGQLNQLWQGYLLALEGEQAARETLAQLKLMYELGSLTSKEVREGKLMVAQADYKVLDAGLKYEEQKTKIATIIGCDGQVLITALANNQWENLMAIRGAGELEK